MDKSIDMADLQQLITGLNRDKASKYGNFRVIPIIGQMEKHHHEVAVASENISGVEISELKNENVNRVQIKSKHKGFVLIMNGQILEGGRQTRSSIRPFIIKKGRKAEIPVNCVEQGRWAYTHSDGSSSTKGFKFSSHHVSTLSKAALSSHRANQGSTWSSISHRQQMYDLSESEAQTQNYVEIEEKVRAKNAPKLDEVRNIMKPAFNQENQRGIIIMKDDEILSCEVFDSIDHWTSISETLLESNLLDFTQDHPHLEDEEIPKTREITDVFSERVDPLVDENSFKIKSHGLEGWAVGLKDDIIYASLYKPQKMDSEPIMQQFTRNVVEEVQEEIDF